MFKWFNNVKIRNKLIGIFLALIAMLAVVGGFSLSALDFLGAAIRHIAHEQFPKHEVVRDLVLQVAFQEEHYFAYTSTLDEAWLAKAREDTTAILAQITQLKEDLKGEPELLATLEQAEVAYRVFEQHSEQYVAFYAAGEPEKGVEKFYEMTAAEDKMGEHVDELALQVQSRVERAFLGAERAGTQATQIIGVVTVTDVAITLGMTFLLTRSIANPVAAMTKVARKMAVGDLTMVVDVKSGDEIGLLGTALNDATVNLRELIGGLRYNAVHLSTTAAELASSSEELSRTTALQSDEISRTSTGVEEMATTIREVARNAELAAQAATDASQRAQAGGELVADTAAGLARADEIMGRLHARSDEIGTIVSLIQDVAAQTNILALNAAIEAAGAGEAGARFDVVAEEIRKLAGRTSQATGEIAELIGAVQVDTQAAAEAISESAVMAKESGASLDKIVEASASVNDMVQSISSATEEQSRASEEIANSVDAMVDSSQQTATATRETAQVGVELSDLAERLKEAASRFKV